MKVVIAERKLQMKLIQPMSNMWIRRPACICPGGAMGRHATLRGWSLQEGAGSSPALGTKFFTI